MKYYVGRLMNINNQPWVEYRIDRWHEVSKQLEFVAVFVDEKAALLFCQSQQGYLMIGIPE